MEIFKPYINPYNGQLTKYLVSDQGRVKDVTGKIIKRHKSGGIRTVYLTEGLGNTCVHLMVLETFVGPRPDNMVGIRLNGNQADNRLENLKWGPRSEIVRKDRIKP